MGDEITIGIRLTADGGAMVGTMKIGRDEIDKLSAATGKASSETEKFTKTQASLSSQLRGVVGELTGYWAAWQLGEKIKEMALLNARHETLGVVMGIVGRNAGYTSAEIEKYAQGVQKMGITMIESRQSVIDLAQSQIDLAQASKLARVAQDAAVIGGINSSEALNRLVYGIKSAQVDVLRTIGLNVNFEDSYKKLADQIHKNVNSLTEAEKSQARTNATLEAGALIAGSYEAAMGTAGKQVTSMARYIDDLKVKQGEVFNEVLTVSVMAFTEHLKDSNAQLDEMAKNNQITEWGKEVTDTFVALADNVNNLGSAMRIVMLTIGASTAALRDPGNFKSYKAEYDKDVADILAGEDRFSKALEKHRQAKAQDARTVYGNDGKISMQFSDAAGKAMWQEQEDAIGIMNRVKPKAAASTPDKSGTSFLQGLQEDIEKIGKGEYAMLRLKAAHHGVTAAAEGLIVKLEKTKIAHQDLIDRQEAQIRSTDNEIERLNRLEMAQSDAQDITNKFTRSKQEQIDMMRLESSVIGQTAQSQRLTIEAARMDLEIRKESLQIMPEYRDEFLKTAQVIRDEYLVALNDSQEASRTFGVGMKTALASYQDEASNTGKQTQQAFSRGFSGAEDALLKFTMHGEGLFKNLGNVASAVADDIARAFIRQNITAPLFNSLFGGGDAAPGLSASSAAFYGPMESSFGPTFTVGVNHSGWGPGDAQTSMRTVSSAVFHSAPRFHTGIGPGERAAVITDDESVLTPGQMRAMGKSGSQNVVVNIIESPGNGGQQRQRDEGGTKIIDVMVEQISSKIAGDISRGSGAVPAALSGTYGLNRVAGAY